jgi:pimeloyl-ACP methyl ester carboxylesterase
MSQGGWITYSLALQYPKSWRRLIPVAGMLHWKTQETAKDFTDEQKKDKKRWHVYIMTGIKDQNPLVADNRRVAGQLEQIGATVLAPFANKRDPSWKLYQDIGHDFPGRTATARTKELVRALNFVLQPDDEDRRNWSKVDPDWPKKAGWSRETPATKKRDSRKNPTGN